MLRRSILITTALSPLAACAGLTAAQVSAQAVADLQLVENGLNALTPVLATIPGITVATVDEAASLIGKATALAQTVTATITQAQAQPIIQQAETYASQALSLVGGLSLPPNVAAVVNAAKVLLPVIEIAVGLSTPAAATPNSMSPAQARAVLAAA